MQLQSTVTLTITLMLLLVSTTSLAASESNERIAKTRQDASHSKAARDFQPASQFEPRFAMTQLPSAGKTIDSYLKYCEAVIHAMESELPRKSIFRSLFVDKSRLASGYDKHVKFSYYDLLKNLPGQDY